jgi:23S rRNA (cytosine1962-C5)-methyltransferase
VQRLNLRKVLNCFCYTGGFSVAALAGMRAAEQAEGGQGGGGDFHRFVRPRAGAGPRHVLLNGFDGTGPVHGRRCERIAAPVS